ncbi:Type I restriction enzyme specificity protein MG438 [Mesomycoplasma conjunctivae]|nr:Type I restriction enzyme specificity protein MG438 [Mesomycoplasma conjunctivae]
MEKSLKPKIRFRNHFGLWRHRKLFEIGTIIAGNTPSTKIAEYYAKKGLMWVNILDIKSDITIDTQKKLSTKGVAVAKVVPANSILCSVVAILGRNTLILEKSALNQALTALTPSKFYDPYFLYIDSFNWTKSMQNLGAGSLFQIVNKTDFSNITTLVPDLEEQQLIGNFFRKLNRILNTYQAKITKLESIKNILLNKMFVQPTNQPLIRFKDYNSLWKINILAELASIKKGEQVNRNDFVKNGKYPVWNGGIEPSGYYNKFNTEENTILIAEGGSTGFVNFSKQKFWSGGHNYTLQNVKLDTYFLFYNLKNQQDFITSLKLGTALTNLQKHRLSRVFISFSRDFEEQQKIAKLFKNIDNLLNLYELKLQKIEIIKTSLLDKMFIIY